MAARAGSRSRLVLGLVVTAILSPLVLVGALWVVRAFESEPTEYVIFGPAGQAMLTGDFSAVFSSKLVQAGPFELAPFGVAQILGINTTPGWVLFYVVLGVIATGAFVFALLATMPPGRRGERIILAGAALAIVSTVIPHAVQSAHISHIAVPILWVFAAMRARRGGLISAGLLVAASAGFETWGALGVAVLVLGPLTRVWRGVIALIAGIAVIYLPFVLAGSFQMLSMTWGILPHSLLKFFAPGITEMSWPLRLLQGVLAIGAGAATALIARSRVEVVWLIPLSVLALRLAFDPLDFGYYFISPALVLVALAAVYASQKRWIAASVGAVLAVAVAFVLSLAGPLSEVTTPGLVVLVLVAAASTALAARRRPTGTPIL